MAEKKNREKADGRAGEETFTRLLRRGLANWYCGALYAGRVRAADGRNRGSRPPKKA